MITFFRLEISVEADDNRILIDQDGDIIIICPEQIDVLCAALKRAKKECLDNRGFAGD
jgi:hypothetical protein